jgi:hypothetical protein
MAGQTNIARRSAEAQTAQAKAAAARVAAARRERRRRVMIVCGASVAALAVVAFVAD